ncbi:hypothetical protein [Sorangium sp. So ce1000]|uniref:hypothetical protein n=1 Tax=Sorangium sp. So ce1000 TaxID=3133325 RepID=UPI003F5ED479
MTSLVAWVGVDHRKPASLNIASDSRISWKDAAVDLGHWNFGRKLFASRTTPDIFGYVGKIEFPVTALGQIVSGLESGLIPAHLDDASKKAVLIQQKLESAFFKLPKSQQKDALILHGAREGTRMRCEFRLWTIALSHTGIQVTSIHIPSTSSVLVIEGSGSKPIETWHTRWEASSQRGTSRAVFSAFCDALAEGRDSASGGAPQLVGIYRIGHGRTFGIIHEGRFWYNGVEFDQPSAAAASEIEWRNRLFERCDSTGKRLENAQAHHAPKGLGGRRKARR